MEYEFLHDLAGQIKVRMSMGHEAVGHWFNEEIKENLGLLDQIEAAIAEISSSERHWQYTGHEYTLWLDKEEVIIRANQLALEDDGMEEGMHYYDEESLSFCGTDDFLQVIAAYRDFVHEKR
ncbi:protein YacL [Enterobacteriaceae bacterium LUAb1]